MVTTGSRLGHQMLRPARSPSLPSYQGRNLRSHLSFPGLNKAEQDPYSSLQRTAGRPQWRHTIFKYNSPLWGLKPPVKFICWESVVCIGEAVDAEVWFAKADFLRRSVCCQVATASVGRLDGHLRAQGGLASGWDPFGVAGCSGFRRCGVWLGRRTVVLKSHSFDLL